jgi:regulator of protease activity HflC (stomatin/prohibitin superfamily)
MKMQRTHHSNATQYLLASLITLVIGVAVLAAGMYIIKKAENSVVKYEASYTKKDKH